MKLFVLALLLLSANFSYAENIKKGQQEILYKTDSIKDDIYVEVEEDSVEDNEDMSSVMVGNKGVYTVKNGESLKLVAAKLGVTRQHLIELNELDPDKKLTDGQELNYDNRKIIPQKRKDGIVINIPDRTLYLFKNGTLKRSVPVAVGLPTKNEKYDWRTPVGRFRINAKTKDPTWTVPPSIQQEMKESGS